LFKYWHLKKASNAIDTHWLASLNSRILHGTNPIPTSISNMQTTVQ